MVRVTVTDPDGVVWRVWRRWYAWRRWLTFGDVGAAVPSSSSASSDLDWIVAFPFLILGLAATTIDLAAQVVALPFVLLARVFGLATWPVQLEREKKHFRTARTKGFGAAAALRDDLVGQVHNGSLPGRPLPEPPAPPAAPTPPEPAPAT